MSDKMNELDVLKELWNGIKEAYKFNTPSKNLLMYIIIYIIILVLILMFKYRKYLIALLIIPVANLFRYLFKGKRRKVRGYERGLN